MPKKNKKEFVLAIETSSSMDQQMDIVIALIQSMLTYFLKVADTSPIEITLMKFSDLPEVLCKARLVTREMVDEIMSNLGTWLRPHGKVEYLPMMKEINRLLQGKNNVATCLFSTGYFDGDQFELDHLTSFNLLNFAMDFGEKGRYTRILPAISYQIFPCGYMKNFLETITYLVDAPDWSGTFCFECCWKSDPKKCSDCQKNIAPI